VDLEFWLVNWFAGERASRVEVFADREAAFAAAQA
jgi:hypothetical protein